MTTDDLLPAFINERQAALRLGVSIALMRLWRRTGNGPGYYRFNPGSKRGAIRYRIAELDAWLETTRVGG